MVGNVLEVSERSDVESGLYGSFSEAEGSVLMIVVAVFVLESEDFEM